MRVCVVGIGDEVHLRCVLAWRNEYTIQWGVHAGSVHRRRVNAGESQARDVVKFTKVREAEVVTGTLVVESGILSVVVGRVR